MHREIPLDRLEVASPCPVDWDAMSGDDRVRHCGACARNVYNLSAMSSGEAARFVAGHEGRLCVRFYRQADGKVMTSDCPRGVRTAARKAWAALAAGVIVAISTVVAGQYAWSLDTAPLRPADGDGQVSVVEKFRAVYARICAGLRRTEMPVVGMVDVVGEALPPQPPSAPPSK